MQSKYGIRAGLCAAVMTLLSACAPGSYAVKNPAPSNLAFATPAPQTAISVVDQRAGSERVFFSGVLASTLTVDGTPIDAPAYLSRNLQAELASRGVPAQVSAGEGAFPRLDLKSFRMQNYRATGFSPFVSFTFLSVDLETATGKQRLGVFIKRGKVPVWSFDEVIEPTLNQPLSLAVKELAAKVAGRLYGSRSSDGEVERLAAKLKSRNDDSYLDVYALGFTNNEKAVSTLVDLTKDADEYVRIAAISSLGTLGAKDQLDLLKTIYRDGGIWQDRAMALKSIGDLDTPESKAFLAEQLAALQAQGTDKDAAWSMQVIGLYM